MTSRRLAIILCCVFFVSLGVLTAVKLRRLSDLDIIQINSQRTYYPRVLGRIYQNKITHSFRLAEITLFSYLNTDNLFPNFHE